MPRVLDVLPFHVGSRRPPGQRPSGWVRLVLALATLTAAACGTASSPPSAAPSPSSALRADGPAGGAQIPLQNGALEAGQRYTVELLPDLLDAEFVAPDAEAHIHYSTAVIALASEPTFATNSLVLTAAGVVSVPEDEHRNLEEYASRADQESAMLPLPEDALAYLADRPYAQVLQGPREVSVAGLTGRAVDVRIGDMPAQARCTGADEPCAVLFVMPQFVAVAYPGESYQLVELDTPTGEVLVLRSLQTSGVVELVESLQLRERPFPPPLSGARHVAFLGQELVPGELYAVPIGQVFVAFRAPSVPLRASPVGDRELSLVSLTGGRQTLRLHVAPTSTLRTADDGIDPIALLGDVDGQSRPLPRGGLGRWLADQSWVDVSSGPRAGQLADREAQLTTATLEAGAPSADCSLVGFGRPGQRCAFVGSSSSGELLYVDESRRVTVADVDVEGDALTVLSLGDDVTEGTLRLVTAE